MKFVNRFSEIKYLHKEWQGKKSALIVIYGRRRIGKTELIKEFIKDKEYLYFLGRKVSEKDNLQFLTLALSQKYKDSFLEKQPFFSWDSFFEYLLNKVRKKTVIVFDEFPYFVSATKGLSSIFQYWWDNKLKDNPHLFLILCGSSISMMLEEVLLYKAPLYGRRTGQILLAPMSFFDSWKFFPKKHFASFLNFFSVTGGVPEYLKRFTKYQKLSSAFKNEVFLKQSPLYEEVDFILKEELREPKNYFSILKSLALKRNKISEIITETGLPKSAIHNYLFNLENLNLVTKEVPPTEKNPLKSRKGRYWLTDNFFRFWFNFVLPLKETVEIEDSPNITSRLKKYFPALVEQTYEKVAQEILLSKKQVIGQFSKIGRYWDKEIEIDLLAVNEEKNKILFGEVKWSKKKVGVNIFKSLLEKSRKINWGKKGEREEVFVLFSKSGFSRGIKERAKKEKVFLFQGEKLL